MTFSESCEHRYTSFLDLSITLEDSHVVYSTYRKPMCTYSFLPSVSCHSKASKLAIVHGEVIRYLRTNMFETDFCREKQFLLCKLRDRGYGFDEIRLVADKYCWSMKTDIVAKKSESVREENYSF